MSQTPEIKPGQSVELLKELHILTRDGKLNQDSRRKLKQVYHLYHFIEPLLQDVLAAGKGLTHCGIYISGDKFIHAENEKTGVVISTFNDFYRDTRLIRS